MTDLKEHDVMTEKEGSWTENIVTWTENMDNRKCDGCSYPITSLFYDMKTKMQSPFNGAWGVLCSNCAFKGIGVGYCGTGFGQEYKLQEDGTTWLQTQ